MSQKNHQYNITKEQSTNHLINNDPNDNTNDDNDDVVRSDHRSSMVSSMQLLNNMEKINMVPGFILKLWKMINDPQCDDLISWSDNGQSFIILDPQKFSFELSKYFKHNNLSSFIRQLNMYGFRKVATIENSGLHSGADDLHFYHPDFVRDQPDGLDAIKRKLPQKLADSVDLRNVYRGISEIDDKQKDVSKTLTDIKHENEMLWAELYDLRQKHQQQQLYISRLMKLVFEAMEQNGIKTNMLQLKRNSPLMIEAANSSDWTDTIFNATPAAAQSPTKQVCFTTTKASSSMDAPTGLDTMIESLIPVSVLGEQQQQHSVTIDQSRARPVIAATTVIGDDTHSLKKSRLSTEEGANKVGCDLTESINLVNNAYPLNDRNQQEQQDSTFQQQQNIQSPRQQNDIDLRTPLVEDNYDPACHFTMIPNDQLQSQINSAEYQIDTLVPTISDFGDDELSLFTD